MGTYQSCYTRTYKTMEESIIKLPWTLQFQFTIEQAQNPFEQRALMTAGSHEQLPFKGLSWQDETRKVGGPKPKNLKPQALKPQSLAAYVPRRPAQGQKRENTAREGLPLGSKDPNKGVLGAKYYKINAIWALKPYYLGPWMSLDP